MNKQPQHAGMVELAEHYRNPKPLLSFIRAGGRSHSKTMGGRETYWQWTARTRVDCWNVSYNKRFHSPDAVIRAFEKFGFICGR